MSLRAGGWRGPDGVSHRPGAQALGLAAGQPSVGYGRMACRLGLNAQSSFARQSPLMEELGLGTASREKLRQGVEAEGQRVQEAQQRQAFALSWSAGEQASSASPIGPLCVGVDGVMTRQVTDQEKLKRRRKVAGRRAARSRAGQELQPLPPRRPGADGPWKEVKIVGAYQAQHEHRHWASTTWCHLMAAVLITQVTRRVGMDLQQIVVAVVDGAEWIEARLREGLPHLAAVILDFYHLSEHGHAATHEVFGEGSVLAQEWAERLLHAIRQEGYEAFDALLGQCLIQQATTPAAQAA